MGNNIYKQLVLHFFFWTFLFFLPKDGFCQIKISIIDKKKIAASDTLKFCVRNFTNQNGYYNVALEIYENKKWRIIKSDIFNDFPMASVFQNISKQSQVDKFFVVDAILLNLFGDHKALSLRLLLTYSYSPRLKQTSTSYSEKITLLINDAKNEN